MSEHVVRECPVPRGALIIIGGKENKGETEIENREKPDGFNPLEILTRFIELTDKEDPVVEVITTASGDGEESFEEYKKLFTQLGVNSIGQIHHTEREEALSNELIDRIANSDAFYFSGGDQLRLASIYGGTRFLTEMKKRYIYDPIVIGGTSAGAMALSTPMIYAGNKEHEQISGEIKITTGLEFLKDVCVDTHFVHRGRFIRLAQVIATNPTCIGLGIEEDTAVIVRNGLDAEVLGSGTVIVIEGFNISGITIEDFENKKPVSIRNLKVDILAKGNCFKIVQTNPPHI